MLQYNITLYVGQYDYYEVYVAMQYHIECWAI